MRNFTFIAAASRQIHVPGNSRTPRQRLLLFATDIERGKRSSKTRRGAAGPAYYLCHILWCVQVRLERSLMMLLNRYAFPFYRLYHDDRAMQRDAIDWRSSMLMQSRVDDFYVISRTGLVIKSIGFQLCHKQRMTYAPLFLITLLTHIKYHESPVCTRHSVESRVRTHKARIHGEDTAITRNETSAGRTI